MYTERPGATNPEGTFLPVMRVAKKMTRYTRKDSISAEASRVIDCSIAKLFEFVLDPFNDPKWIDVIRSVSKNGAKDIAVGTQISQIAVGPIGQAHVTWEFVEIYRERRIFCRSVGGEYRFSGGYEFESIDSRVRIRKFASFQRTGMLKVVPKSIGDVMMEKMFQKWLDTLRHIMNEPPRL
jgi:hypothetical protein